MARLLEPEKPIVVGRARIEGQPCIDACAPDAVGVHPGQRIRVIFQYQLEENSRGQETYAFRLASSLGPYRAKLAEARFSDHWGWPDSVWGFISQEYRLDQPGTYDLDVSIEANYGTRRWLESGEFSEEISRAEQWIRVTVHGDA